MNDDPMPDLTDPQEIQDDTTRRGGRELLYGVGAFLLFLLGSLGLLMLANSGKSGLALFSRTRSPVGEGPIDLTVLHTNDTWGYFAPCG